MKNKKPITVRLNGKKTNKNKRNKYDGPTEFQSVDREQAATIENADEPIPTFARKSDNTNPLNKKSKWSAFKPVVISVSARSEEHTSELQSRGHLVCRLLLEKK